MFACSNFWNSFTNGFILNGLISACLWSSRLGRCCWALLPRASRQFTLHCRVYSNNSNFGTNSRVPCNNFAKWTRANKRSIPITEGRREPNELHPKPYTAIHSTRTDEKTLRKTLIAIYYKYRIDWTSSYNGVSMNVHREESVTKNSRTAWTVML